MRTGKSQQSDQSSRTILELTFALTHCSRSNLFEPPFDSFDTKMLNSKLKDFSVI